MVRFVLAAWHAVWQVLVWQSSLVRDADAFKLASTSKDTLDKDRLRKVFGKLAPYKDGETVKRAYEADDQKTLMVETDLSAWNNIRMSWEETVCYAYRSHRIFRLPAIPQNAYSDPRVIFGRHLNLFSYYDERSFKMVVPSLLDSDPTPHSEWKEPEVSVFVKEPKDYAEPNLIYKGGREHSNLRALGAYAADQHLVPHEEYLSLIESAFKVRWDLLDRAMNRLSAHGLVPGQYVAIHRRRDDFDKAYNQENPGIMNNEAVVRYVAPDIKGKTVLVITDTYDPDFLQKIKDIAGAERVVCWANEHVPGVANPEYHWRRDSEGNDDEVYAPQTDMLAAVAAKTFIGTPHSTFSFGIVRWRVQSGWHKIGTPLKFLIPFTEGNSGWDTAGARGTYFIQKLWSMSNTTANHSAHILS